MAFIDTDEFIRIKDGRTLKEILASISNSSVGVYIPWEMHGADCQEFKTIGGMRERFPTVVCMDGRGKCIVRTKDVKIMYPHWPFMQEHLMVNINGSPLIDWMHGIDCGVVLEHYYTRSWEEWQNKITRGCCMPDALKRIDEFFEYNPNMEYLREKVDCSVRQKYNH